MRRSLLLSCLLPLLWGQQGDVQVDAELNRHRVQVGETVLLTVRAEGPGLLTPEIREPALDGLEILSSSDRSAFRFAGPAGATREFSREYTLQVERAGSLMIPPIQVSIGDELYETAALQLTAVSGNAPAAIPDGLAPLAGEEVALRLWVEPETAYVGQQVTLTVAALFDPAVRSRLQRQPEYRPPDVEGVWTAEIPGSARPEKRVVEGREYFVQIFRRALFPLSPGRLAIPAAAVVYEMRRGLIYAPETFQIESRPARIDVQPLPEEGRPPQFAGAVGRYEAEVWLDRADLRAGEAVNLTVEVRGVGNLSSLARPELPEIPDTRIYDGGEDAEVQVQDARFAGHKRFSWVLVPERAGRFVVPELRLPFFDPSTERYEIAETEPITFDVAAGTGIAGRGEAAARALRYLKDTPGWQPVGLHREPAFWLGLLVPLLLLVAVFGIRRVKRSSGASRKRPRRGQQALNGLEDQVESADPAFFSALRRIVLDWLATRLQLPELSSRGIMHIQHVLEDAGVPPEVALDMIDLLETCSRLRYAPEPPAIADRRAALSRARKLLAAVDREAVAERHIGASSSGRIPGSLFALCVAAATLAPGSYAQNGETSSSQKAFRAGVAAYGRGDYEAAIRSFERAREARPQDPHVLYNLGNAYYESGAPGRAVALWVRALRIAPRDEDARANLETAVGADPIIGEALPPIPVSKDELAVIVAVLWIATCLLVWARARWRLGYLSFCAGSTMLLCLLAAAMLLAPRGRYAIILGENAVLRAGPVQPSEALARPTPGTAYRVREERDTWLRVSRGGDAEGWVQSQYVEVIG